MTYLIINYILGDTTYYKLGLNEGFGGIYRNEQLSVSQDQE